MRLAAIHMYPVKGCHRVDLDRAEVEPWGLAGDRRWLVVDPATGQAVTQRDAPVMTRVRPEPLAAGVGMVLRTPEMADLVVTRPNERELVEFTLWGYPGEAVPAGCAADDWLSTALDRKVRLVWMDDPTRRAVEPEYAQPGDRVTFADAYPVMLANLASLDALNDLIAESGSVEGPLPMTRFRPNLVVAGASAWAEDGWTGGRVRVGEVTFRVAKPCDRCVVTTTDQETGERGREPLRTLGRHRNVNQKLRFGTNLIPDGRGTVHVGDPVEPV